jgi:phage-related holin
MDVFTFSKQLLFKICFLVIAYLSPINMIFHAIWFLIAVDLLTGIWKSIKAGDRVRSSGLRATAEKFLFYTLSIVVVFIVDEVFFNNSSHLASIIGAYIALTELLSIFENVAVITGHDIYIKIKEVIRNTLSDKITKNTGTNP